MPKINENLVKNLAPKLLAKFLPSPVVGMVEGQFANLHARREELLRYVETVCVRVCCLKGISNSHVVHHANRVFRELAGLAEPDPEVRVRVRLAVLFPRVYVDSPHGQTVNLISK